MATLSYEERTLAGTCTYPGCESPCQDDNLLCPEHAAGHASRSASYRARKKREWTAAKCCLRCGATKRKPGRVWCARCVTQVGRLRTDRDDRDKDRDKSNRITVDIERDGYGRERYHGRARRGAMSKVETVRQGLEEAAKSIAKALDGVTEYETEHVQSLPRIQREAVLDAAVSHADHAERFLDEVRELVREKRKRVG